ncbi:flagellar hook capping FlgD N-terminal domain-containing protein, partial [Bacillus sp. WP8]|uniref:flagellar hook capping FlgD N-terminal domain-containing protein n=1 Tax=Bacillus sp. WP8 TaxID=756828 RepID=UPI0028CB21F3
LHTHLQNQNPTNPLHHREFVTHLPTFSSLQHQTNINHSITNLNHLISTFLPHQHPFTTYLPSIAKQVSRNLHDKHISPT